MKTLKLERQSESKKTRHALAAANLRRELKYRFPNTKFAVRSSSYAGGSSVNVSWIDGESPDTIKPIVNKYQYGSFDGMEDIYNYDQDFSGEYGEAKYTFTNRSYSDAAYQDALKNATLYDDEELELYYDRNGLANGFKTDFCDCQSRVYTAMRERNYNIDGLECA